MLLYDLPPTEIRCNCNCQRDGMEDPMLSCTAKILWFYINSQTDKSFVKDLYNSTDPWDEMFSYIMELKVMGYFPEYIDSN